MEIKEYSTIEKLKNKFTEDILEVLEFRGDLSILVKPAKLLDIFHFLKNDPELDYNYLSDITAMDWLERKPRFDLVYQLRSLKFNYIITVKTQLDDGEKIPSATAVWESANWLEREVYDLFGIDFSNHPGLRRIVTPDHWENHPLRKDYPLTGKNEPLFFPSEEDIDTR